MTKILCGWKLCANNREGDCVMKWIHLQAETIEYKDEDRSTESILKCDSYTAKLKKVK